MRERKYRVSGMTCGHCEASVREQVAGVPGVRRVVVSVTTGLMQVDSEETVDDDQVVAAVANAGYSAKQVA